MNDELAGTQRRFLSPRRARYTRGCFKRYRERSRSIRFPFNDIR